MIIEGDHTDKSLSYFEDMLSSGYNLDGKNKIEIVSTGENLYDKNSVQAGVRLEGNLDGTLTSDPLFSLSDYTRVNPGSTIVVNDKGASYSALYDINKNFIKEIVMNDTEFNAPKNAFYIRMNISNQRVQHIKLYDKSTYTSDEDLDYKESRYNIPLKEPLRSLLNGVSDKIVKRNGRWYIERNLKEVEIREFNSSWQIESKNGNQFLNTMNFLPHKIDSECDSNRLAFSPITTAYLPPHGAISTKVLEEKQWRVYIPGFTTKTEYDNWIKNNPMKVVYQLPNPEYEPIGFDLDILLLDDINHIYTNSIVPAEISFSIDRVINLSKKYVEIAKVNPTIDNLSKARFWVNQIGDSSIKDSLQGDLNMLTGITSPDFEITKKTTSSNIDLYIESQNSLSLSLNTNSIQFNDFSGIEDMEKQRVITLEVSSSLPYMIKAYLTSDITNSSGTNTMNKDILQIKANESISYQSFLNTTTPIIIWDDQTATNNTSHSLDLRLKGGISHKKDVYRAVVRLEVSQK